MAEKQTQHATIEVEISIPVEEGTHNGERIEQINNAMEEILSTAKGVEYRGVRGATTLGRVETAEETAERRMAEAEGEALAKAERRYERFLEERGSRYR